VSRIAVVLFNLGGPDSLKAVRFFLLNLFSDPAILRLPKPLRLPLAWLTADDGASSGVTVRERSLVIGDEGGPVLRNAWTLAPFERVTRHFHIGAERS
jgi:hypothetical protein